MEAALLDCRCLVDGVFTQAADIHWWSALQGGAGRRPMHTYCEEHQQRGTTALARLYSASIYFFGRARNFD